MLCSVGEVLEGIHITMPYSIASYMVRDFLREGSPTGAIDEELVGTLTGVLVSSANCSRWTNADNNDLIETCKAEGRYPFYCNLDVDACAGKHILPQPVRDVLLLGPLLRQVGARDSLQSCLQLLMGPYESLHILQVVLTLYCCILCLQVWPERCPHAQHCFGRSQLPSCLALGEAMQPPRWLG